MSAEVLTIVISAAALLVTLGGAAFGLTAWVVGRIDALGQRLESKFDAQGQRLESKLDAQGERLESKLDAQGERLGVVQHELGEVKIAVARLEGPPCRLLVTG